jgi:hypothetical protein
MSHSDGPSGDGPEDETSASPDKPRSLSPPPKPHSRPVHAPPDNASPAQDSDVARPLEDEPTHIMPPGAQRAMQAEAAAGAAAPEDPGGRDEPTRPGDVSYERFLFESRHPGPGPSGVDGGAAAPPTERSRASSGVVLAVAFLASGVGGAVGSGATMLALRTNSAPPSGPRATPSASVVAPAPAAAASSRSALELAAAELKRLKALAPDERTAAETIALGRHRQSDRAAEVAELGEEMRRNPALARDQARLRRLEGYAADPVTAFDALGAMAALPGPESADLLYRTWVGRPERTEVTALAAELVYSKDVLRKASEPLRVALDLRREQTCEEYALVLPRAKEHGDRRSLKVLAGLMRYQMGCGPNLTADCHACLRGSKALAQAIGAVRGRAPPRY